MTNTEHRKPLHLGRNVKRLREILDIKQEVLASKLGSEWNQKKVSLLEDKEVIDADLLEELAKAMKVPVEAIKNFNEEATINNIQNNYEGANVHESHNGPNYYNCTIGTSVDKRLEALEEKIEQLMKLLEKK